MTQAAFVYMWCYFGGGRGLCVAVRVAYHASKQRKRELRCDRIGISEAPLGQCGLGLASCHNSTSAATVLIDSLP